MLTSQDYNPSSVVYVPEPTRAIYRNLAEYHFGYPVMQKFSWVLPKKDGEISKKFDLQKTLFVNRTMHFFTVIFCKTLGFIKKPQYVFETNFST